MCVFWNKCSQSVQTCSMELLTNQSKLAIVDAPSPKEPRQGAIMDVSYPLTCLHKGWRSVTEWILW